MQTASWNGVVLAQSEECVVVEGNQYFPPSALRMEYFKPSTHTSICGWKGKASYYDIEVNGQRNENAAWYYPDTLEAANNIRGYIGFWKGVELTAA